MFYIKGEEGRGQRALSMARGGRAAQKKRKKSIGVARGLFHSFFRSVLVSMELRLSISHPFPFFVSLSCCHFPLRVAVTWRPPSESPYSSTPLLFLAAAWM